MQQDLTPASHEDDTAQAGTPASGPVRPSTRLMLVAPILGALYGLVIRTAAGWLGPWLKSVGLTASIAGVMSASFLLATPFVMGMITVHAQRRGGVSWRFALFGPWAATLVMMLGAMLTLLEGAICVALMSPLFLGLSSLGGVVMKLLQLAWGLRGRFVGGMAALPLLALLIEGPLDQADRWQSLDRSVVVAAPPERVWTEILDARAIQAGEMPATLIHLIGVPRPVEGVNRQRPDGEVRESRWERGVHFLGRVTRREEQREIAWRYEFAPDSFPPGTMDEHVVIGGQYFDLGETRFQLTPLDGGRTRLDIQAHYRVSSSVNVYAVPVAAWLGRDFVDALLALYQRRAERPDPRPRGEVRPGH